MLNETAFAQYIKDVLGPRPSYVRRADQPGWTVAQWDAAFMILKQANRENRLDDEPHRPASAHAIAKMEVRKAMLGAFGKYEDQGEPLGPHFDGDDGKAYLDPSPTSLPYDMLAEIEGAREDRSTLDLANAAPMRETRVPRLWAIAYVLALLFGFVYIWHWLAN